MFASLNKRLFFTVILLILFLFPISSQESTEIISKRFDTAMVLRDTFITEMEQQEISDPNFYLAIVYPEIQRYSEMRNQVETLLNAITYTTLPEYEGFSIGIFQMKPNFIKQLEDFITEDETLKDKYADLLFNTNPSSFSTRYQRIVRLQNNTFITRYLMAFVDISLKKYNLQNESVYTQLKYLGAIYNSGFKQNLSDYDIFLTAKLFQIDSPSGKIFCNYSDLVVEIYNNFTMN